MLNTTIYQNLKKALVVLNVTKEDYDLIKKNSPSVLAIVNEEKVPIFALSYAEGKPCVSTFGIVAGGTTADGKLSIEEDLSGVKPEKYNEYLAEKYTGAVAYAEQVCAAVSAKATELRGARAAFAGNIQRA